MSEEFEDSFDESELDERTKDIIKKEAKEFLKKKKLTTQWREEIECNIAIQEYFKGYSESSIEHFVNSYLDKKYRAHKYKKYYAKKLERKRTQWIDKADDHLEFILQKKLFDFQCLWRAEQVELEGVEICFDFDVWEGDIFNCPFLEIHDDDIKMYQDFLNSGALDSDWWTSDWQDYYSLKEDDSEMPEWYDYHNMHTGNSALLLLPNLRGDKEEFYVGLYRDEENKNHPPSEWKYDPKPSLSVYDEEFMKFVNEFEDAESRTMLENLHNEESGYDRSEDFNDVVRRMDEVEEFIPIESHYDYRQALRIAYFKYYFGKIAEHLPQAYEQYLFTKSMNLGASKGAYSDEIRGYSDTYREKIIKGRILNGEPGDLNF